MKGREEQRSKEHNRDGIRAQGRSEGRGHPWDSIYMIGEGGLWATPSSQTYFFGVLKVLHGWKISHQNEDLS